MNKNYSFQMKQRECDWVQDYMVMLVNGEVVGMENVTNIHETFTERCNQVRANLIRKYENAQSRKLAELAVR